MRSGTHEGEVEDDEFPGRFFAEWEPEPLRAVMVGVGFSRSRCASTTAASGSR